MSMRVGTCSKSDASDLCRSAQFFSSLPLLTWGFLQAQHPFSFGFCGSGTLSVVFLTVDQVGTQSSAQLTINQRQLVANRQRLAVE